MNPNRKLCPPRIVEAFENYRDRGVPPSDFVRACLENNLLEAHTRADDDNLEALPHIVAWLYWEMPASLWRSHEAVEVHLEAKLEPEPERDEPIIYNRGDLSPRDGRTEDDRTL